MITTARFQCLHRLCCCGRVLQKYEVTLTRRTLQSQSAKLSPAVLGHWKAGSKEQDKKGQPAKNRNARLGAKTEPKNHAQNYNGNNRCELNCKNDG